MGEWLFIIGFGIIFFLVYMFGGPIDKNKDDYLSGEDGNDHYEG
jgi:hypothetical protein